jgi:hypothetical protein
MNELKRKYMHMKRASIPSLAVAICLGAGLTGLPAQSETPTTDEGQAKLMRDVNAGQKSNQLTPKEANKLRKDLSHVAREKANMLAKTDRKLDTADTAKLKSDISQVSDKIHKHEQEKHE